MTRVVDVDDHIPDGLSRRGAGERCWRPPRRQAEGRGAPAVCPGAWGIIGPIYQFPAGLDKMVIIMIADHGKFEFLMESFTRVLCLLFDGKTVSVTKNILLLTI